MNQTRSEPTLIRQGLLVEPDTTAAPLAAGDVAQLAASQCTPCGHVEFPRLSHCPTCGERAEPIGLATEATLAGFSSVLHAPPGAGIEVPYDVGVAQFPEGICVMGLLLGAAEDEPPILGATLETVVAEVFPGCLSYAFQM